MCALCWANMRKHLFIVQEQETISHVKILQLSFIFHKNTHSKDATTEEGRMCAVGIGYTHMYGKYE